MKLLKGIVLPKLNLKHTPSQPYPNNPELFYHFVRLNPKLSKANVDAEFRRDVPAAWRNYAEVFGFCRAVEGGCCRLKGLDRIWEDGLLLLWAFFHL